MADKTAAILNRQAIETTTKAKQRLSVLKFDELNVGKEIDALYSWLDKNNRRKFKELYIARYIELWLFLKRRPRFPKDREDIVDELAEMYITGLLSEPNEVLHYVYETEVLRKRDRAKEAVLSVPTKVQKQIELDKALRFWAQMSAWYADFTSQGAEIQVFKDCGIKYVQRHEQGDDKVCHECRKADGEICEIDKIPELPHPRCRRWFTKSDEKPKDSIDKSDKDGIIKSDKKPKTLKFPDIIIGRSVGAKARNYDIEDLETGEHYNLVENTHLQDVEVFAGKGVRDPYRKAYKYAEKYGGKAEDWQHVKASGYIDYYGKSRPANIHWSQCAGVGKFDFFIKEWLD